MNVLRLVASNECPPPSQIETNPSKSGVRRRKPLFVLHVGPSKTGTTTIQWFAAYHKYLLEKDNIHYLGHFKNATSTEMNLHILNPLCYSCPKEEEKCPECDDRWDEFEKAVDYHYSLGHNVFVSNEMFSGFRTEESEKKPMWDHLTPILRKWNVRVVFSYRRYYEWVPSKYFQLYSPGTEKTGKKWPDDGGRITPLFPDYSDSHRKDTFKHPLLLKRKWESHFSNVWVFNMHEDGDILANFYCSMLPEAKQACKFLSNREQESSTINPSANKLLQYDSIAIEAYTRGWVNKKRSRSEVRGAVEEYAKELGWETLDDFPLKCLSPTQADAFLNSSLSMEKELLPEFYSSPKGKKEHELGFARASKKGKFCSVHVDEVLNNDNWKRFFQDRFG